MKKILLLILINGYAIISISQSTRYFVHALGDPYPAVQNTLFVKQLNSGNYITAGANLNNVTNFEYALLFKTDVYGNLTVDSSYADTTVIFSLWNDGLLDTDGNLVLAGCHKNIDTNFYRTWLVKMDTTGNIIWSKLFNDTTHESEADCVKKTLDNGYIIGGQSLSGSPGSGFVIKTDAAGNQLWERIFVAPANNNAIAGIALQADSSFVFTGVYNGFGNFDGYIWMLHLDKSGNTLKDTFYNFGPGNFNCGVSIGLSLETGYIIGGYDGGYVGFLLKLNGSFDTVWRKMVIGPQNVQIECAFQKIVILSDGSIVGCGFSGVLGAFMTKFDSSGNQLWIRLYKISSGNNQDYAYSMDTTSDGGFILCGRTERSQGEDDLFIKTNCLGFVAPPTASFIDSLGYYSTIYFTNTSINTDTCYWNWGDGSSVQMVRADSTTPVLHTYTSQGPFNVTLIAIACGEADTVIVQTPLVTGVANPLNEKQVLIYPNPNDGSFTLSYILSSTNNQLQINDVLGRTVYTQSINNPNQTIINCSQLSNGVYFYQLSNSMETLRGKFVKE